jgi:hypothetical protein
MLKIFRGMLEILAYYFLTLILVFAGGLAHKLHLYALDVRIGLWMETKWGPFLKRRADTMADDISATLYPKSDD